MSKIDELLEDFDVWCRCESRECQRAVNYKQSKQAIYNLLAKEAKHLIMSDGIRREAVPLSRIKEMFGVSE